MILKKKARPQQKQDDKEFIWNKLLMKLASMLGIARWTQCHHLNLQKLQMKRINIREFTFNFALQDQNEESCKTTAR
jgi:hypothetical protein